MQSPFRDGEDLAISYQRLAFVFSILGHPLIADR
jgi:hypothetical protein